MTTDRMVANVAPCPSSFCEDGVDQHYLELRRRGDQILSTTCTECRGRGWVVAGEPYEPAGREACVHGRYEPHSTGKPAYRWCDPWGNDDGA